MTVRYIIGRAGSGKSEYCFEAIRRRLAAGEDGPPLILLVPEQSTFQAERKLVAAPGLHGFIRAQVLSFRRLAFRVMQETGGTARVHIAENGKKMLLHKLIHNLKDELKAFRSAADEPGFVGKVAEMIEELKRYRVKPEELERLLARDAGGVGDGPLADKLADIAAVYVAFEQAMRGLYVDTEDNLEWLAEHFGESSYAGAEVWIDGFHGFTPQELAVVAAMMRHCRSVSVALCVDRLYDAGEEPDEWSLFHPTATTLIKLRRLCADCGVAEAPPVLLPGMGPTRHAGSPMLAALERMWDEPPRSGGEIRYLREDIRLVAAPHRRAEAEAAALRMLALVRDEGCRWRDMAVFVRNLADYRDVLAAALNDFGIPHFFDQKRTVNHHPLIELIRAAMDVVRSGWRFDAVFRAVKTGLLLGPCASEAEEAERRMAMDRLENYVLAFGIRGNRWKDEKPWSSVPYASLEERTEEQTERERQLLEDVNASRNRVAAPLMKFETSIKSAATVAEMAAAVFAFLEDIGAAAQLEAWADDGLRRGETERAREHAGLWGSVVDVLDQLVEMIGDERIGFDAFAELLDAGLEEIKLGLVPPALDQVMIGSMDRSRLGEIKHVFILGASDGVLPAVPQEDGLISETERTALAGMGVELAPSSRRRLLDEQFIVYAALTLPSQSLWISYPLADDEGRALPPSEVIGRILRLFPQLKVEPAQHEAPEGADDDAALAFISGQERTLSQLVVQLRRAKRHEALAEAWWAAYNWFCTSPGWRDKLGRRLSSLFYRNQEEPLHPETSRLLYGLPLRASVSRMELFAACRFAHFAGYGLRLAERRIYKLAAPDIGQLFHAALSRIGGELMKEGLSWEALTPAQCAERAAAAVDALSPYLQNEILASSARYRYVARKLKQVVGKAAAVLAEQSRVGSFRTIGLELGFGPGQPLPPLRFSLAGGAEMEIVGRIDRIDRADGMDGTILRIIDYKSSGTELDLAKVYYGLSLQMLAYLDVVVTNARRWLGVTAKPGGMLYFHVHQPLIRSAARLAPEEAEAELMKRYRTKGLVLADAETVRLMDGTLEGGGRSLFYPVAIKADGEFHRNASVMTEGQWEKLKRHGRGKIREIGEAIVQGRVDIAPYRIGQQTPCAYCSFKPVCQFDAEVDGNGYKRLIPYTQDEIWAQFGEGEER